MPHPVALLVDRALTLRHAIDRSREDMSADVLDADKALGESAAAVCDAFGPVEVVRGTVEAVDTEAAEDAPPARPVGRVAVGRTLDWLLYEAPGRSPYTEQTIVRSVILDALGKLAPTTEVALLMRGDNDEAINVTFPSGTAIRVTIGAAPPPPSDWDAVEVTS